MWIIDSIDLQAPYFGGGSPILSSTYSYHDKYDVTDDYNGRKLYTHEDSSGSEGSPPPKTYLDTAAVLVQRSTTTSLGSYLSRTATTLASETIPILTEQTYETTLTNGAVTILSSTTTALTLKEITVTTSTADSGDMATITVQTYLTVPKPGGQAEAVISAVVIEDNQWGWVISKGDATPGSVYGLDDVGYSIDGSWDVPRNTSSIAVAAQVGYTYNTEDAVNDEEERTLSHTETAQITAVFSGQNPAWHNGYDQIPVAEMETWTGSSAVTTLMTSGVTLFQGYSVPSGTRTQSGATSLQTKYLIVDAVTTCVGFAYDDAGQITGTVAQNIKSTRLTATELPVTDYYVHTGYSHDSFDQGTTGSGITYSYSYDDVVEAAAGYTLQVNQPCQNIGMFYPGATIMEAAFDSAVRLGNSGKCDQIENGGTTIYYPFYSQVWDGLWMPMSYGRTASAVYDGTSISFGTNSDSSESFTESGVDTNGCRTQLRYSWGAPQADDTNVTAIPLTITETTIDLAADVSGTRSHKFTINGAQNNDKSYHTTREVPGGPGGNGFCAGGHQWNNNDVSVFLGKGIWEIVSHGEGTAPGNSQRITVGDQVQNVAIPQGSVAAFRGLPSFELLGSVDAPDLLNQLIVFPK